MDERHGSDHLSTRQSSKRAGLANSPSSTAAQKLRNGTPFPAWRLPGGIKSASDIDLERSESSFERWAIGSGIVVVAGLLVEVAIAIVHPAYDSHTGRVVPVIADFMVALGVAGEVIFAMLGGRRGAELRRRSNDELATALDRLAKAEVRAAEVDLARAELETKLLPRMLNQDQWDFIQELRGKFSEIAIAFETDAETRWFSFQLRDAFFSAGMKVAMYPRAADVHSFGTLIFEPNGFDGARPKTVGPLVEIFHKADLPGSLAIITGLPTDVARSRDDTVPELRLPLDAPIVIVGGRFVIPPPHIENAAKMAKAARDAMAKQKGEQYT